MKVLKFGGTSVGTVESLKEVKKIVEAIEGKAIIVVSALGGLTDKLISTAKLAENNEEAYIKEMDGIRNRHYQIIESLVPAKSMKTTLDKVNELLDDLERIYKGVSLIRSLPEQTLDLIVSYGERMSSIIVAAIIQNGKKHDSLKFIKTENWYGKNVAERKLTESGIKEEFSFLEENEKAIVPGFISTDMGSGVITNLGRGGSDYTGALIAAALDAEILEIWTDVDGFMTADPRIVKEAIVIDHLTYNESMELCSFGAKVIYPPTIYPVFHKNIPIKILNTFHSDAPGTLITDNHRKEDLPIKGVSSLKGLAMISVQVKNPNDIDDISGRAYNALSKEGVKLIPMDNDTENNRILFAVTDSDKDKTFKILEKEFAPEISSNTLLSIDLKTNLAAVAIVGREMQTNQRLAARIMNSIIRNGIGVEASSIGNSETTLLFVVDSDNSNEAISIIHSLIY